MLTLPTSSASRRFFTSRAVIDVPSWPASGAVLMPTVIDRLGSSMWITGSGRGSSGSASVSPMVMSAMPATATISPGPASSAGTRSNASVTYSSATRARSIVPSARHQATGRPLRSVPERTRHSASRPTYGEASRFVTSACSGTSGSNVGAGMRSTSRSSSGCSVAPAGRPAAVGRPLHRRRALARHAVDDREVELVDVGIEVEEQLLDVVDDLGDPGVGTVDLVDDEDHRQLRLERLAQHEAGLRQRPLRRVDEQQHAVDHRQRPLDLAAEVGVARGVDDVDRHVATGRVVAHGRVLGEDRDALLALEVHRVHDPLADVLVGAEGAGLPQHLVDERRLAVVDVGHDGHVPEVVTRSAPWKGTGEGQGVGTAVTMTLLL